VLGKEKFNEIQKLNSEHNTTEHFIQKHGFDYATKIAESKAIAKKSYWVEKYGKNLGYIKWKKYLSKIKQTKENFINRHGDAGLDLWDKYLERRKYVMSEDYYIEKYGINEGSKIWNDVKKTFSFTKDDYIKKYGENAWTNCIKARRANQKSYSQESIDAFDLLLDRLIKEGFKIESLYWKEKEWHLYNPALRKNYFYDLSFKIRDRRYIIEYDTPFMHPNPKYMTKEDLATWVNPFDINADPLIKYEYDNQKKDFAESQGYNIFTFYVDKNNSVDANINKIINNIKENYDNVRN
jgi:hypothetical protein